MERFKAAQIREAMDQSILPFINERKETGYFERLPGKKLYYEHLRADEEKAVMVLLHGFTECAPKFYETAYYFMQLGFSVWLLEQEGHGFSYKDAKEPSLVYIPRYKDLIEDLHYFITNVVNAGDNKKASLLFGHSMGGGVSSLLLETYPDDVENAILSSPMLEINNGGMAVWKAALLTDMLRLAGKGNDYLPGGQPFNGKSDLVGSCTNCQERYDYDLERQLAHEEYQTCAAAAATAREFLKITKNAVKEENVAKIKARAILFQAEKDGTVLPGGQNLFMERLGAKGKLVVINNAKHEIYRCTDEIMDQYWGEIESFVSPILKG